MNSSATPSPPALEQVGGAGSSSAFFGALSFGGVLCLHFPQLLSSPELRPHYPMHVMRLLIQGLIIAALFFGVVSSILRKKKVLALTGMSLAFAAAALGGSSVPINQTLTDGPAIGLDWFLLDMFLMALIYVPIERLWPQYRDQGTFRDQWTLDVVYFMSTHLPIQILSFLVLLPATQAAKFLAIPSLANSSINALADPVSIWRSSWRTSRNGRFIGHCTRCPFYGGFIPSTIRPKRSIGSPAHAPISSTTPWCAALSSFP
jgi:hypothetical protein